MQSPLRVCRRGAAAPCVPPRCPLPLTAGFLSLTLWFECDVCCVARGDTRATPGDVARQCVVFWLGGRGPRVGRLWAAIWKTGGYVQTKNPACFSGEQGSRKSMIYGEIVNYLPASFVRFRPNVTVVKIAGAEPRWVAGMLSRMIGFPGAGTISAQRRRAADCERLGYVRSEVIGSEGNR